MKQAIKRLYCVIKKITDELTRDNVASFSAAAAFFLFVSMLPMLYVLCTLISFTSVTEHTLIEAIEVVSPNVVGDFFAGIISDVYGNSVGVVSVAILITLWSAGKGMLALMRGLNEINQVQEHRNFILIRIIAGIYTLIMLVLIVISFVFLGFGKVITELVLESVPITQVIFDTVMKFRFLYVWPMLTVFFAFIYAFVPNKKSRLRFQLPGAVLAALSWNGFSWAFSVYIKYFGGYGGYGSLTTIILVLIWMYFSMYILFIGAKVNLLITDKINISVDNY